MPRRNRRPGMTHEPGPWSDSKIRALVGSKAMTPRTREDKAPEAAPEAAPVAPSPAPSAPSRRRAGTRPVTPPVTLSPDEILYLRAVVPGYLWPMGGHESDADDAPRHLCAEVRPTDPAVSRRLGEILKVYPMPRGGVLVSGPAAEVLCSAVYGSLKPIERAKIDQVRRSVAVYSALSPEERTAKRRTKEARAERRPAA